MVVVHFRTYSLTEVKAEWSNSGVEWSGRKVLERKLLTEQCLGTFDMGWTSQPSAWTLHETFSQLQENFQPQDESLLPRENNCKQTVGQLEDMGKVFRLGSY